MPHIHPTAIVDPAAQLADSVTIGPYTIIQADVTIDADTAVDSHCLIDHGARIGRNVRIHHSSVVSSPPQDLKYAGEPTECFIGDGTTIRELVTVNRGTTATRRTVVGKHCLLMAFTHVAHDCVLGDNIVLANCAQLGGHTHIGDHAILGGHVAVHQFSHIGSHVMIGAQARVVKDIPPYALAAHEPVSFIKLNLVGLRRRGFSAETIEQIDHAYRILYYSGKNITDALDHIRSTMSMIPEVQLIVDFISLSTRGIIRAFKARGNTE